MAEAMSEREQVEVLESIARDEGAYDRDRIAAVKALQEIARRSGDAVDRELQALLAAK